MPKSHRAAATCTDASPQGLYRCPRLLRGDWPGADCASQPLMSRSDKMPGPRQGRSTLSSRLLARLSTVVKSTSKSRRALAWRAVSTAPGPLRANPTPVQAPATELPLAPTNRVAYTNFCCVSEYHAPPRLASDGEFHTESSLRARRSPSSLAKVLPEGYILVHSQSRASWTLMTLDPQSVPIIIESNKYIYVVC